MLLMSPPKKEHTGRMGVYTEENREKHDKRLCRSRKVKRFVVTK